MISNENCQITDLLILFYLLSEILINLEEIRSKELGWKEKIWENKLKSFILYYFSLFW